MSRILQIAISLLITAGAIYYSLSGVELGAFLEDLSGARWGWIGPIAGLAALTLWFRACRWRILLGTLGPIDQTPVFDATCIGFMGNMVLPLRAGEAIKPVVVARAGQVSIPAALATVALERVCDLVLLAIFGLITLLLVPSAHFLRDNTTIIGSVVAGLFLAFGLVIWKAPWLEARVGWISDRLPTWLGGLVDEGGRGFLRSVSGLSDLSVLLPVFAYSALIWLATVAGFISVALALEISAPLIPLGFASTVIIALAVSVPSAPGFIGVFWAGAEIALELFGQPKSLGFSFGVLSWLVQMVVIIGLGGWSMTRVGLSLGDMRRTAAAQEDA